MKILVPTDFSKLSEVAIDYAFQLRREMKAEIWLMNAVYLDAPPKAQAALKSRFILEAMAKNSEADFITLTRKIRKKYGSALKVKYQVVISKSVEKAVCDFSEKHSIDLVIMGTKGAGGLKKVIFGSNAASVISDSTVPVIAVPEKAKFRGIKNLLYASDMRAVTKELKSVVKFARHFGSRIHIVNIYPASSATVLSGESTDNLMQKFRYPRYSFSILRNDNIKKAINRYCIREKADLLVMFTHRPTFFERLFGKSITRESVFHTRVPLLAIKR